MLRSQLEDAVQKGIQHAKEGKSIHYNPYRNLSVEYTRQFVDWENGYRCASNKILN